MTKCNQCGIDLAEGAKFCSGCGAAVNPAADAPQKAPPQKAKKAPAPNADDNNEPLDKNRVANAIPESAAPTETVAQPLMESPAQPASASAQAAPAPTSQTCGETPPAPGSRYEPITTKGFIGIMFLMLIPLVNLLLLLVWAFGGCRKVNKQNFAKAMLVWMLIAIGLSIIFGLMFWAFFPSGGFQGLQESLLNGMIEP